MDENNDVKRDRSTNDQGQADNRHQSKQSSSLSIVDGLRVVFGLLLLNFLVSYLVTGDSVTWGYRAWWLRPQALMARMRQPVVLTDAELAKYDGRNESLPIYLALNGTIYDVSAGRSTYAPGGPYHFFAGRDAARAFVTGCFQDDSVPDYRGVEWAFIPKDVQNFTTQPDEDLDPAQRDYRYEMVDKALRDVEGTIEHWAKTFRGDTGKEYFEVGYVKRPKRWMDRVPLRELCAKAERQRPKGKFDESKTYKRTKRAEQARLDEIRWAKLGKEKKGSKKDRVHDEV